MKSISARLEAAERAIHSDGQPALALFDHDGAPLNDAARRVAASHDAPTAGAFTIRIDRAEVDDASEK